MLIGCTSTSTSQDNTNILLSSPQQDIERLNFENTIDLSNIVVKATTMPTTDIQQQQQQTTQLSTINLADLETATANMLKANGKINTVSYANLTPVNMNTGMYRNNELSQFEENSNSQNFYDDDDIEDDDEDEDYQVTKQGNKRTRSRAGTINSKRFSTTSTNSSTQMTTPIVKSTKGRKPKSETTAGAKITGESEVARFGNKYVKKGTDEYDIRRNRNNEAVKKCREKSQVKQAEREERLKLLTEENRKLSNTVDSLNKELSVLKNILLQMNPQNRLPNELEEKINRLESMILSNNTKS